MKAERRHQLQENSLIRGVHNFPQFWKDYGSKILLVIILFLLTVVLVRYWLGSREQTKQAVAEQLTSARVVLEQYRRGEAGPAVLGDDPQATQMLPFAAQQFGDAAIPIVFLGTDADTRIRNRVREQVENAVNETLQKSSDPARQAEATLLRADLNLYFGLLASAEATAAPTTQPATKKFEKSPEDYFKTARTGYEELINQAGQVPPAVATGARFGLAAIHENEGKLPEAKELYEKIFNSGHTATAKKIAGARIDLLARLPANPLVGPPMTPKPDTQPATAPGTLPATTQGATQPATTQAATTQADAPSARPANGDSKASPTTKPAADESPDTKPQTAPTTKPVEIP